MSDSPFDLDLKFMPDWVKQSPDTNKYADYQGDTGDRGPRNRDDRGPRGPRPGGRGPSPQRREGGPGPRGDRPRSDRPGDRSRGPRPGGGGGDRPRGDRPGQRHGHGPQGGGRRDDARPPREAPRPAPATLKIEFLPEPNAAAGIAKQIKASGRAYPVFGTSKLFLERPERHRVRVTSSDPAVPLFQVADGPISFDRANVEKNAFFAAKAEYYTEETIQGEPIKGNFSNVARVKGTGVLLGPTNYHGYQPALRKLYEERFSRRMSFPEFQQYEIEIVSDEQAVADWKEQARTSTNFTTTKEAEPITFKTAFDTEQHFRKQYLPQIVKSGQTLECSGQASRASADRFVAGAIRAEWEKESHFPQQIVNGLRPYFVEAGLHFFKHRKRVLYVSATKPVRHPVGQVFSDGITAILGAVEATPRIKRPDLGTKLLGEQHDSPEAAPRKEQLASDLHYLIHSGHVIEFSNGMLELPLAPQDKTAKAPNASQPAKAGAAGATAEASAETTAEEVTAGAAAEELAAEDATPPAEEEVAVTTPASEMPAALQEVVTSESAPETAPQTEAPIAEASVAEVPIAAAPEAPVHTPEAPVEEVHATDPAA